MFSIIIALVNLCFLKNSFYYHLRRISKRLEVNTCLQSAIFNQKSFHFSYQGLHLEFYNFKNVIYPKLGVIYACIWIPLVGGSKSVVPQAISIRLCWELVRNANSWALPQTYRVRNSGRAAQKSDAWTSSPGGQMRARVWEPLLLVMEGFWTLEKHYPTLNLSSRSISSNPNPQSAQQSGCFEMASSNRIHPPEKMCVNSDAFFFHDT